MRTDLVWACLAAGLPPGSLVVGASRYNWGTMTPEAALRRQIELYRAMTGEQRLKISLDLHEFACNVAREGIRRQFPGATPEEVEAHLRKRIELSRQ
jgi:hypothetical protein